MNPDPVRTAWRWYFFAAALEAGAAFVALALIPSEGRMSFLRLGLFAALLGFVILGLFFGLRPPRRLAAVARPAAALSAALLALGIGLALFLLRYLDPERLLPIYTRLSPLLWFLLIASIQSALFLIYLRRGFHLHALSARKPVLLTALVPFFILLFVFFLAASTRLGLTPDPAYWGEPGVPVQAWQFALALLAGFFIFCFSLLQPASHRRDLLIPLAVWLLAILLWLSVPVEVLQNGFYAAIDPPAHQPFPYSDAGYYDSMAHSLLIGQPYQDEVPTRPLYIVFLSALHLLFRENYAMIIAGQTAVLALIPVVLYLIGAKIHSPAAGVTIAGLAIFREFTTLLISSETRVSNTKMLLVDLPTLLFLATACLFALRWLERRDARSAFLAGGTFGLFVLLRTQSFLVLPFLFLAAVLAHGLKNRAWAPALVVFLLGVTVTVGPWLTHNYLRLGQFTFDAPFQYKVLASQYAYTGNLDIQNYDFADKSLARVLVDFALTDPAFVFGFIANHFLAGEIGGLLALPLIVPYPGVFEPVNLYWLHWDGNLAWYNALLILIYLAVISVGLGAAWRRWRWAGLLPLAFNLGYALATAVGRFSGWRYDLPADWAAYFYFGIGFVECLGLAALLFGAKLEAGEASRADGHPEAASGSLSIKPLLPLAIVFMLIGSLPWLAELPARPRYPAVGGQSLEARFVGVPGAANPHEIDAFLQQDEAVILEGRLLYPRYFYRDAGMSSANAWPAYAVRDYPRTGFVLLNRTLQDALFPGRDAQPFPHAADTILLGCLREDFIEVRLIAFPEQNLFFSSAPLSEPCTAN